jgi:hypothetical protein
MDGLAARARGIVLFLKIVPRILLCIFICTTPEVLPAQRTAKNELGLAIGATVTPSVALAEGGNLHFDSSLALGVEYDRRLLVYRGATFLAGVDFLASPFDVKLNFPPINVSPNYAYLFLAPHVRVKFNAAGKLQPWLLLGGGYAAFTAARPSPATSFSGGTSTGTLEFGGGVDSKPLVHLLGIPIGARLEARDFYSGGPSYNQAVSGSLQNNVVYTGGLLICF